MSRSPSIFLAVVLGLAVAGGCGKKTPPSPAAEPAPATPAATEAPEPEPEPVAEPEPDAPPAPNADFGASITKAGGGSKQGKVVRVERGEDWYAEEGWTDDSGDLTVTLEGGGTEVEKPWTEIASIDVKYGGKSDIDCMYDSQYTPWMYMCTLRTTTTAKTTDGKTWTVVSRHKWRFTFADGSTEEFYLNKLPVREQDSEVVSLESASPENYDLYAKLQAEAMKQASSSVTRIAISE